MASDLPPPSSLSSPSSDTELIESLRAGELDALGQLYDKYATLIHTLVYRILADAEDAEDITQEVFLKIWKQPHRYDPKRGALSTFLVTMARMRAIDQLRRRGSRFRFLQRWQRTLTNPASSENPLEFAALDERALRVQSALNHLSDKERQVLELSYYDGLSYSETAQRLNIPLGTIKSRARSGLKKLRSVLKQPH